MFWHFLGQDEEAERERRRQEEEDREYEARRKKREEERRKKEEEAWEREQQALAELQGGKVGWIVTHLCRTRRHLTHHKSSQKEYYYKHDSFLQKSDEALSKPASEDETAEDKMEETQDKFGEDNIDPVMLSYMAKLKDQKEKEKQVGRKCDAVKNVSVNLVFIALPTVNF